MDTFVLEEIIDHHFIDVRWFIPFTIYRLQPLSSGRTVTLDIVLQNIQQEPVVSRQLQLTWLTEDLSLGTRPVQDHVITEWAACGIACVVTPLYTNLQILQVAQSGDRFDYWIGNEQYELGLEISGTATGDLEQRHRRKILQLRSNPHLVDGYVSVTDFQMGRTILSFHSYVGS